MEEEELIPLPFEATHIDKVWDSIHQWDSDKNKNKNKSDEKIKTNMTTTTTATTTTTTDMMTNDEGNSPRRRDDDDEQKDTTQDLMVERIDLSTKLVYVTHV